MTGSTSRASRKRPLACSAKCSRRCSAHRLPGEDSEVAEWSDSRSNEAQPLERSRRRSRSSRKRTSGSTRQAQSRWNWHVRPRYSSRNQSPLPAALLPLHTRVRSAQAGGGRALARRRLRPDNGSAEGELSPNERFLRDLYERCKMINVRIAGYLNGSCEVISIETEELELGFYYPFHSKRSN